MFPTINFLERDDFALFLIHKRKRFEAAPSVAVGKAGRHNITHSQTGA